MKRYLLIIAFILLTACKPPAPQTNETITNITNATKETATPLLSLSEVLDEFAALDADLNTTWKKEQIPDNMIRPLAVEQWTKRLKLLEDLTEKNSSANRLVQARLEMLRSQVAYYLGAEIGEKGIVPLKQEGETFTPGLVACENRKEIEKATKLYHISYKHYGKFVTLMDDILQNSVEAREKIGIDENRLAFYEAPFKYGQNKMDTITKAVEEQCNYVISLEDTK